MATSYDAWLRQLGANSPAVQATAATNSKNELGTGSTFDKMLDVFSKVLGGASGGGIAGGGSIPAIQPFHYTLAPGVHPDITNAAADRQAKAGQIQVAQQELALKQKLAQQEMALKQAEMDRQAQQDALVQQLLPLEVAQKQASLESTLTGTEATKQNTQFNAADRPYKQIMQALGIEGTATDIAATKQGMEIKANMSPEELSILRDRAKMMSIQAGNFSAMSDAELQQVLLGNVYTAGQIAEQPIRREGLELGNQYTQGQINRQPYIEQGDQLDNLLKFNSLFTPTKDGKGTDTASQKSRREMATVLAIEALGEEYGIDLKPNFVSNITTGKVDYEDGAMRSMLQVSNDSGVPLSKIMAQVSSFTDRALGAGSSTQSGPSIQTAADFVGLEPVEKKKTVPKQETTQVQESGAQERSGIPTEREKFLGSAKPSTLTPKQQRIKDNVREGKAWYGLGKAPAGVEPSNKPSLDPLSNALMSTPAGIKVTDFDPTADYVKNPEGKKMPRIGAGRFNFLKTATGETPGLANLIQEIQSNGIPAMVVSDDGTLTDFMYMGRYGLTSYSATMKARGQKVDDGTLFRVFQSPDKFDQILELTGANAASQQAAQNSVDAANAAQAREEEIANTNFEEKFKLVPGRM